MRLTPCHQRVVRGGGNGLPKPGTPPLLAARATRRVPPNITAAKGIGPTLRQTSRIEKTMKNAMTGIVIHCRDTYVMAPFWSAATGWPIAAEDLDRLRTKSLPDTEAVRLVAPVGPDLWLVPAMQLLPHGRVHLDLTLDHRRLRQVLDSGARIVERRGWWVLEDPEGNLFCVHQSPADFSISDRSLTGH